jgi:hypothetical protein
LTPQMSGQRVDDLVRFVVEHYPTEVRAALKRGRSSSISGR